MDWFEEQIQVAQKDGVTRPENFPFLLKPEKIGRRAVLLIHGFGSSPREMLPLGQALVRESLLVYALRLPGHGTTPEDLAERTAEEWLTVCKKAYLELVSKGFSVSIAGLSTGALLSMKLALRFPVERMILLSPFFKLMHPLAAAAKILSYVVPYQKKEILPEEQPFYYQRRPLKGVAQINRLRWQLARESYDISTPTLILAAKGDKTIADGTAEEVFERIGSPEKLFHLYGIDVPHVLTGDQNPEKEDALRRCCRFLTVSGDQDSQSS